MRFLTLPLFVGSTWAHALPDLAKKALRREDDKSPLKLRIFSRAWVKQTRAATEGRTTIDT
jgi:hypothetical protein